MAIVVDSFTRQSRHKQEFATDSVSVKVITTMGSNTVHLGDTAGIHVGDCIAGFGIPVGVTVTAVDPKTLTLTLSQAAPLTGEAITFIGRYDYFSNGRHIDLRTVDIESSTDRLNGAIANFDARAAAAILEAADPTSKLGATGNDLLKTFLEESKYSAVPKFYTLAPTSLAMMAYADFFPNDIASYRSTQRTGDYLRNLVNLGIMNASPGYCGTFGPGVDDQVSLLFNQLSQNPSEGNYDMNQTHLIPLAYGYYDYLDSESREHLIGRLLAGGIIHRPNESDITTSGPLPDDWERAGYIALTAELEGIIAGLAGLAAGLGPLGGLLGIGGIGSVKDIGETENHIISMLSARYLTNQLLYQRDPKPDYDNRRNAKNGGPTCMSLVLAQLRNILRCDFSEYNAKSYQEETRWPIRNLATYAYDHEVRLAARMVLDYVSAHIAVSSNDLRRIVPFRRRNQGENVRQVKVNGKDVMYVGLVEWQWGADPLAQYFAMQAGNVRVYQTPNPSATDRDKPADPIKNSPVRPWSSGIAVDGTDATKEVLSAYRLPLPIHDLFVNDLHRRFYQRLHRTPQDEAEKSRNCDNFELYASSPSYLITAGGQPAKYAIDSSVGPIKIDSSQQAGVAMPTTFMPTGHSLNTAADLIQFSHFSADFDYGGNGIPEYLNYGVAPDFACGHDLYVPLWLLLRAKNGQIPPLNVSGWHFIDFGSDGTSAGFYLAIYTDGDFALLEAFDTWLHPGVSFEDFQGKVRGNNAGIDLHALDGAGNQATDQGDVYETYYGTVIEFSIWLDHTGFKHPDSKAGATIKSIEYSKTQHPTDALGDAGNVAGPFLNGTILNSHPEPEVVVEISNPFYGPLDSKIILDMTDQAHPRRTSETGEVEQAGHNNEVWVNFGWTGPTEGDFFHPFNTLTTAVNAVADGGVVKIVPGWTAERPAFVAKKRCKIVAPIGGVRIGVQ